MKNIAHAQTDIAEINWVTHNSFKSEPKGVYNQVWQCCLLSLQHSSRMESGKCGRLFIS